MAIYVLTSEPRTLLATFKQAIDNKRVVTWAYDSDGDFTHTTAQWERQAWLRPTILSGKLVLTIIRPKAKKINTEIYAIYHGRFIESLLAHCDKLFTQAYASAMPESGDDV